MRYAKALARRVIPDSVKRLLRPVRNRFRPENRLFTTRLPVARAALAYGSLRLACGPPRRPFGMARLSRVCVINLADRSDRLAAFNLEAKRLGLEDIERVEGVKHENGALGCAQAHALCVQEQLNRSWSSMMVCEDDAAFLLPRRHLDVLIDRFLDDTQAEVACLAYFHQRVRPYSSLFLRALETQTTTCYIVKASIAPELLAILEEGVCQLTRGGDPFRYCADQAWKSLQQDHVFVVPIRRAAYQRAGYSDIERRDVDYGV
jgi:glycosyl transferase, family 25